MPLWERLMDLADTMVSSKTQWSRMSDGAAAISLLHAQSSSALFPAQERLLKKHPPHKLMHCMEILIQYLD